jgi:hypothetical protein
VAGKHALSALFLRRVRINQPERFERAPTPWLKRIVNG